MGRRVIVTRPAREAPRWVEELRVAGFDAQALPLIAIEATGVANAPALQAAREGIGSYAALMFVSAAAVEHFLTPAVAVPDGFDGASPMSSTRPRFWATGPGTVRALRQAGVPDARIDAPPDAAGQFDSETLWASVRTQIGAGSRVLIVRGGDAADRPTGRDWLAREIAAAGGVLDTVVAYRRLAPELGAAELQRAAEAASDGTVWLFSSSESIGHLVRAMPETDWRGACAIATHPRIGETARAAGFGTVRLSQPGSAALAASIESFT